MCQKDLSHLDFNTVKHVKYDKINDILIEEDRYIIRITKIIIKIKSLLFILLIFLPYIKKIISLMETLSEKNVYYPSR